MTWRWGNGLVLKPACCLLFLLACGLTPARAQLSAASAPAPASSAAPAPAGSSADAFDLEIQAPDSVRPYLERHLDLQRYHAVADLDNGELARLLTVAERDTRELLATLGYFSPEVSFSQRDTPGGARAQRHVTGSVKPGEPTRISEVAINFSGPLSSDPALEAQRRAIRNGWKLRAGMVFSQAAWDESKNEALRLLTNKHFPKGQVLLSQADVDPQARTAALSVTLDSGPLYKLGLLQITGLKNYSAVNVERLARLTPGADYDQTELLQAQQRLSDSGYFDSAFITLDTDGDPAHAPVQVQLREARRQKVVLGIGASTDSGPRVSLEHTHHQLPGLGWAELSKLSLDRATQSLGVELRAPLDDDNWRWVTSALAQRETAGSFKLFSQRLRAGKSQSDDKYDRAYFLQYDRANTTEPGVADSSALSINYAWTQRKFDSMPFPGSGHGLSLEVGGGSTLGSDRQPFTRVRARWLSLWPLAKADDNTPDAFKAGRLALRLEGGAVVARENANLPDTQLFLTGGDATVRGYAYNAIGTPQAGGLVAAGRYLAVGSLEWQRPIKIRNDYTQWEQTVFIDAGAVADEVRQLHAKVGLGTGVRWKSPVGPLQMDVAYGVAERRLRLHLSVGFSF